MTLTAEQIEKQSAYIEDLIDRKLDRMFATRMASKSIFFKIAMRRYEDNPPPSIGWPVFLVLLNRGGKKWEASTHDCRGETVRLNERAALAIMRVLTPEQIAKAIADYIDRPL